MKSRKAMLGAAFAFALILSGCASSDDSGASAQSSSSDQSADGDEAQATDRGGPEDGAADGDDTSPNDAVADSGPIKLGMSTPLSGATADLGRNEKKGAQLAIDEINADGGVLGHQLELVALDNECNPTAAVKNANTLFEQHDLTAIFGGMCSSATLAIAPLAARAAIPMINSIGTSPEIGTQAGAGGNDWLFVTNPSDSSMGAGICNYVADSTDLHNLVVVGVDTDYGRGGAKALRNSCPKVGIEIGDALFFELGTTDFSALISKISGGNFDAVALYAQGDDQINFIRQYHSFGVGLPLTGRVEVGAVQADLLSAGALAGATSIFPYAAQVDTPENKAFVKAFEAANESAPIYQSFEGYQEVKIIAAAIESADSADPTAVRDALKGISIKSLMGATIEFDDHNTAHDNAVILKVQDDGSPAVEAIVPTGDK